MTNRWTQTALLLGLFWVTSACYGQRGRFRRGPFRRPGFSPWVYDVDRTRGYVWAGVDHPYFQPRIPFSTRPAQETNRQRYERWMVEGRRAVKRKEWKVARHRFEEARDLASQSWGDRSRQALAAAGALHALRPSEAIPFPANAPAPVELSDRSVEPPKGFSSLGELPEEVMAPAPAPNQSVMPAARTLKEKLAAIRQRRLVSEARRREASLPNSSGSVR